jgi:hypothetical protein
MLCLRYFQIFTSVKFLLIILSSIYLSTHLLANQISYVIKSKDHTELGNLVVNRTIENGKEEILVHSEIKVKKLITVVISYSLHSSFQKKTLITNDIITFRNRMPQDIMSTRKRDDGYLFTKNSKETKVKNFNFCESMMYFNEPIGHNEVYSEFDGVFKPIQRFKKEKRYDLTNPKNKNVSSYYYSDGILEKAVVEHALITLYLYKK